VTTTPEHLEFMRSGTPSEPLLAEAAAQYLNEGKHFEHDAPDILVDLLNQGLLERGQRGELVGRLLWTLAHDAAINNHNDSERSHPRQVVYHRPVLFLDWLKALIAPKWHSTVLNAKPISDPDGLTLRDAFRDVYLHFSHFAKADDYNIIGPDFSWMSLVRGFAYQCRPYQPSTDLFAAMHHGGLNSSICARNTSPMYGQLKNRTTFADVLLNPVVGGRANNNRPTFSIVHDLGLSVNRVYSHNVIPAKRLRGDGRTENIHLRHYQIHIEGCSHETYNVVPVEKDQVYQLLLAATKLLDDFPRLSSKGHRNAMMRLKPAFSSEECHPTLDWIDNKAWIEPKGEQEASSMLLPEVDAPPFVTTEQPQQSTSKRAASSERATQKRGKKNRRRR
jgi:hypothetical protein